MVYYFGKEETKNYIYENKEFGIQIAEKQYNTSEINKQKIISRILEERKENDIILKAKEEQERNLKTDVLKRIEYEIRKVCIKDYEKFEEEIEIIIREEDLKYLFENSKIIIEGIIKNLYKIKGIIFKLDSLDEERTKKIKKLFKNIVRLKETKISYITFKILNDPYRTTYYNI